MKEKNEAIAIRAKEALDKAGVKHKEIAQRIGRSAPTVTDYLNGEVRIPVTVVALIAEITNTSLDWLITGQGPGPGEGHSITKEQLSHYIHGTEEPPKGLTMADAAIMRAVIEGIEEHLSAQELELRPEKKADLVLTLFEMCIEEGKQVDRATIIRLVKLAA